jgi:hypothetical protein
MLSSILKVIALLRGLLDLWRAYQDRLEARRVAEAEEKRIAREEAIQDLNEARDEKEFDRAQDNLVDRKP